MVDSYSKAAPFLVSVPINENDTYIYTVDASPKVEIKKNRNPHRSERRIVVMKNKIGNTGMTLGTVLLLTALSLFLWN